MKAKQKEISVKINPNEVPDADYDIGCSILASSVKRCFEQPGTKEEYEKWLESEEISATIDGMKEYRTVLSKDLSESDLLKKINLVLKVYLIIMLCYRNQITNGICTQAKPMAK